MISVLRIQNIINVILVFMIAMVLFGIMAEGTIQTTNNGGFAGEIPTVG